MNDYQIKFRKPNGEVRKDIIIADSEEEAIYLFQRQWANVRQPTILKIEKLAY